MKKLYRPAMPEADAIHLAVEALYDAADEDTGTGGPDFVRRIFPSVKLVTRAGIQDVPDDRVASLCEAIANARRAG
jgi:proteasome beta subunit